MTYYVDWAPRPNLDFSQLDYIDFAFVLPDEHFALTWDEPNSADMLQQLVKNAHASGTTKVKLSIGGWTGSR
jgi:chitinase